MLERKHLLAFALLLTLVAFTSVSIAVAGGRSLIADLLDSNEVPPSGTGGSGTAVVTLNQGRGEVCFDITTSGLSGPVIADHIHVGDASTNGPVVVNFQGQLSGCVSADAALVKAISQDPTGYYVNLHTALKPGGEVRGQLEKPAVNGGRPLVADVLDSNEVPPSGTGGSGTAVITLNQGRGEVCFDITTSGLSGPVLADHIHDGDAGTNGPVVVNFQGQLSGCVSADAALIKDIRQNPTGFYVNLHTALKPGGEVRGQLEKPGE